MGIEVRPTTGAPASPAQVPLRSAGTPCCNPQFLYISAITIRPTNEQTPNGTKWHQNLAVTALHVIVNGVANIAIAKSFTGIDCL